MSTLSAAGARASSRPLSTAAERPVPPLRALPAPTTRPARLPFLLVVIGLLTGGLLALLMLNTVLAQDAFVLHDLQVRSAALTDQEQALREVVTRQTSPQLLAGRARALGMVPSGNPVFLRVSDGRVLGVPVAAVAPPRVPTPPLVTVLPPLPVLPAVTAARQPGAKPPAGQARPGATRPGVTTAKPTTTKPTTAKPTTAKPTKPGKPTH